MPKTITLPIGGMTGAACQARVQRALSKADGVTTASVNLMTNSASVTYDEAETNPERLVEVVRHVGYDAEIPKAPLSAMQAQREQDDDRESEYRSLRTRAAVTLVVGLATMFAPMTVTTWRVLLVVTTLVMVWPGRDFYIRAWRAAKHG